MKRGPSSLEAARLAALDDYEVLDTPPETEFDEIAALAAAICDAPIAVVNFVSGTRQFFKAEVGLGVRETPLETSFCVKALLERDFLLVPDTAADERFSCNPLVTGEPKLRFYAGALLKTTDDLAIGTLCVLDYKPRTLSHVQEQSLRVLARQVMARLDLKRLAGRQRNDLAEARASEERYRSLFNSIDAGFCVIEMKFDASGFAQDYKFVEVNKSFETYTGISEAAGRWMREIAPSHEQHWFDLYGQVARTGESIRVELPARELGGRWYMVHAYRVDEPNANRVAILFSDLTERKRVEDELANSRDELELITKAAQLGRFDYRPRTQSLWWDDRCRALFGLSPGTPVSYETAFLAGVHPEDRKAAHEAVLDALDPSGSRKFLAEYRTVGIEDGVVRHVVAHGLTFFEDREPIRLIGAVEDVSADRKASVQLRETEERLRLAVRATNDAIWDWDFRTNHVLWNEALHRAYGHALNTVQPTGEWWLKQIHPEDRERIFQSIHAVVDGGGSDWTDEYRFQKADGSYSDVLDRGYVIRSEGDSAVRMVGAMLDVTARKQVERQLERDNELLNEEVVKRAAERDRAEEALRQAQKMEAVGQLTGGIAHDFNNMLTGIIGSLHLIQRSLAAGKLERLDRYIDAANTSAQRAAALTARLLAFGRRQSLDLKPTDINALVSGMEDMLHRTLGEQVAIEVHLGDDLWAGCTDDNQLESALLNLCINARDAMPEGGKLTIETANFEVDERWESSDLPKGEYVVISVSDTGLGMSSSTLKKVFEPFFTTKPVGQGSGLGLSMVYGFARQSGGQVGIYSEPGKGTTVRLYIPRFDGEVEVETTDDRNSPRGDGEVVLIVEDDPSVRLIVLDVLEELGYRSIEAVDAAAAIPIVQSRERIDLLVTDVGLPGLNGRQLAEVARESRPDLRILFITGYAANAAVRSGFLGHGMDMLTKPFAIDALATKIREMLET